MAQEDGYEALKEIYIQKPKDLIGLLKNLKISDFEKPETKTHLALYRSEAVANYYEFTEAIGKIKAKA